MDEETRQPESERGLTAFMLRGFKTIRDLPEFRLGKIAILIGPNGAGKSNLISFFRFLSWALTPPGQLQEYVGRQGGASAILHDGPERTRDIEAHLRLSTDAGVNEYYFRLAYAANDTLIYTEERYRFTRHEWRAEAKWKSLGSGHKEPALAREAEAGDAAARVMLALTRKMIVHQFHNTSETARIRQKWHLDEDRWLKEDGGNLAPFLLRLYREQPEFYHRIVETVRLMIPFFADFDLEPDEAGRVLLRWREKGTDYVFSASQAADGMLRMLALVALLQQPEQDLPNVLILDEPELGLHPYAIELLAGLIRAASKHVQVIVATQSVSLIDHFTPADIVVVERPRRESTFRRLDEEQLEGWLADYSVSELWEKNVIGGRPAR